MSVLDKISFFQQRRDELPNQDLARELAAARNVAGVQEIADNLWNKNQNIASDCLKVLYEIGYIEPALIAPFAKEFLKLLKHKNNRIVWGAMIALSTIADLQAQVIFENSSVIQSVMDKGSVITVDNGVSVLALAASANEGYRKELFPYLLNHLATCRPKDVPQHSEKSLPAVDAMNKDRFIQALDKRMDDLTPSQTARVKKVIRTAASR